MAAAKTCTGCLLWPQTAMRSMESKEQRLRKVSTPPLWHACQFYGLNDHAPAVATVLEQHLVVPLG